MEKLNLQKKLKTIDPYSGILDFLPAPKNTDDTGNDSQQICENDISHLSILSQAQNYIKANVDKLSENNLTDCAEEFLKVLTFSNSDREVINKATRAAQKQNMA